MFDFDLRVSVATLALLLLAGCGSDPEPAPTGPVAPIATRMASADPVAGAVVFRRCTACHTIGEGGPDVDGPNLYGVVGAPVAGRRERYSYTAALRAVGGAWSEEKLDSWLTSPRRFAPGTQMTFVGLASPKDRADVIAYLAAQGGRLPQR